MTSYIGRHAEFYDIFYRDKPYQDEVEFIHKNIISLQNKPISKILELACGTGTHAFLLEQYGYDITAIDYSEGMLSCARKKAKSKNSNINFLQGDMRNLEKNTEQFDLVICLFDSIGYVQTNSSIIKVISGVRDQLNPEGLFIFEFWHAAAMLKNYEPIRVREFSTRQTKIIRISRTSLDSEKQLAEVKYSIYELAKNNNYNSFEETQINRYFSIQEISLFLTMGGFTPVNWFSGFSTDEDISDDTWHVLAVAKKN